MNVVKEDQRQYHTVQGHFLIKNLASFADIIGFLMKARLLLILKYVQKKFKL